MPLRFLTAGESHGPMLTVIVDGLPADLTVDASLIARELGRRQAGYGRGGRMKIESDVAQITGGVRLGRTMGGPVSLLIENLDFPNWQQAMSAEPASQDASPENLRRVLNPRPGHADLAGALKHGHHDIRDVLERASARETAARVAAGALAKVFLGEVGIEVRSHTIAIGEASLPPERNVAWREIEAIPEDSPLRCVDQAAEAAMMAEIDAAREAQDSLGGAFQVIARGVPPGLGSYRSWDTRLDALLAQAVVSIPAVKGIEVGRGIAAASRKGSAVHDEIFFDENLKRFYRKTNRAGGLEGGVTNGENVLVTGYMKPLSTLPRPLKTVNIATKQPASAVVERTDTCAVPAAGVIGEAMVAFVLARAFLEKFGGDSMSETKRNYATYMAQVRDL